MQGRALYYISKAFSTAASKLEKVGYGMNFISVLSALLANKLLLVLCHGWIELLFVSLSWQVRMSKLDYYSMEFWSVFSIDSVVWLISLAWFEERVGLEESFDMLKRGHWANSVNFFCGNIARWQSRILGKAPFIYTGSRRGFLDFSVAN